MIKRPIAHLRWYVAALLCLASVLNYLDRQTLSVLAATIQQELNISTQQYSYITSSFLASYTIMYAVSGRLIDRIGTRRGFLIFVSGWIGANPSFAPIFAACSVLYLIAFACVYWLVGELGVIRQLTPSHS